MAEEILVKEALTGEMIAAGADLTRQLDRTDWPVVGALWFYLHENNAWRLLIVSPTVTSEGALAGYRRVHETLKSFDTPLSLEDLSVVAPEDWRVRTLASAYATGPEIGGRRVSRTAINGQFIDDAFVYRLQPVAPAA